MTRVLVTGGTRESGVRAMLRQWGTGEAGERLAPFRVDLNAHAGWAEAVANRRNDDWHTYNPRRDQGNPIQSVRFMESM
jgi:hypothetical protein